MSLFFGNRIHRARLLLSPDPDPAGGGGGGGGGGDKDKPDLAAITARLDALEKENKELKAKASGGGGNDPDPTKDLTEQARLKREKEEKDRAMQGDLESALKFNLGGTNWLKENEKLLPKEMTDIFSAAEKANYGSAVEKANAIKVGIISTFFNQQSNLDLLTPDQKSAIEDFQKLTNNGKQEKAREIYGMVFEPAFELMKRVKKAELVNRGQSNPTTAQEKYKDKLLKGSRTHYLGEKNNA